MALSICAAVSANWPEYGMIRPILIVCCASADAAKSATATPQSMAKIFRIAFLPKFIRVFLFVAANVVEYFAASSPIFVAIGHLAQIICACSCELAQTSIDWAAAQLPAKYHLPALPAAKSAALNCG